MSGPINHSANQCPTKSLTSEDTGYTYIPPKRIRFKNINDVENFKKRIKAFKSCNSGYVHMQPKLYKPILKELLCYLTTQYAKEKNFLPKSLRLMFTNDLKSSDSESFRIAESRAIAGDIIFSEQALRDKLIDGIKSGYEGESVWVRKWCKNKEDILFWILLHEFTHLFDGFNNNRHDDKFFQQVDRIADEQKFLFS